LIRARIALHRPWLPRLAMCIGLALLVTFFLVLHVDYPVLMLLEALVGLLVCVLVLQRVSAYGGQVLTALKQACREHGLQLTSEAAAALKPDPQHTVAS
jgi:hypothetical protein